MSDFYTKKQRKFWCESCKIFIEYSKMSIDQHKRSKTHLRMEKSDSTFNSKRDKINKHNANLGGLIPSYNYDLRTGQLIDPRGNNMNNTFLNNKTSRNNFNVGSGGTNNDLLEEIKREQLQQIYKEKFNKYKKKEGERVWGKFWDNTYNLPYYYNFITRQSQWDKPEDFDGFDDNNNNNNYIVLNTQNNITENGNNDDVVKKRKKEGIVGEWETVEITNKKNNTEIKKDESHKEIFHMPGIIDQNEFYKLEKNKLSEESEEDIVDDDYSDELDLDETDNNVSQDNKISKVITERSKFYYYKLIDTIDKYIYENKNDKNNLNAQKDTKIDLSKIKNFILFIAKDDLLHINKKLANMGEEIKYVQQTYDKEDKKSIIINDKLKTEENEKVVINFKPKKKIEKKISAFFTENE
jgi:hypothetical protein